MTSMKTRKYLNYCFVICSALSTSSSFAENVENQLPIRIVVVDQQTNVPIERAIASTDQQVEIDQQYLTDEHGIVEVPSLKALSIRTSASKEGYYPSKGTHEIGPWVDDEAGEKVYKIELKPIQNPIPLYAKSYTHYSVFGGPMNPPVSDEWIGYDLEKGDWLSPYGKGMIADLIFLEHGEREGERVVGYYNRTIRLKFSNEKDGILPFVTEEVAGALAGSELASDYIAPLGAYLPEWELEISNDQDSRKAVRHDKNRNYYFRVRTEIDEEGNVISAHYGKIYGDFPNIVHYFNPTLNDRNVEFSVGQNLATVDVEYDRRNPQPYIDAKKSIKVSRP